MVARVTQFLDFLHRNFLSDQTKNRIERVIFAIAIASFFVHLFLILLVDLKIIEITEHANLFTNPIAAIYTPFSFVLIYEVYLLIFFLPKSITVYIGKQYEIMTLILIRHLFKDFANLKLSADWFTIRADLIFTYDLITALVLFFLISIFYGLNPPKEEQKANYDFQKGKLSASTNRFIQTKNWIAAMLVPVFFITAAYSLYDWLGQSYFGAVAQSAEPPKLDSIFFAQFFTILILVDVLLLLISFLRTDRFSLMIRNSGFVISTILIKVSFGTVGLLNNLLMISAVLFGVCILAIQKRYDRLEQSS